jgi:lipase
VRLHLHEWGDASAPPVVCLHGVTGHGGRFRRLAEERLADRYHVLAPDLRGHGRSLSEPPWDAGAHLDDVLETVGVERADWIGHSFGGRLVAELAAREPERVAHAVLLDPALTVLPHVALDLAEHERTDVSFVSPEEAAQARYDSARVLLAPKELIVEDESEHLEPSPDGRLRHRYCKSAVITAWSVMASAAPPPARVPTLFVMGAESWLVLDQHVDAYRAELDGLLELVTVPGGHSVLWDAFGETAAAVGAFLS